MKCNRCLFTFEIPQRTGDSVSACNCPVCGALLDKSEVENALTDRSFPPGKWTEKHKRHQSGIYQDNGRRIGSAVSLPFPLFESLEWFALDNHGKQYGPAFIEDLVRQPWCNAQTPIWSPGMLTWLNLNNATDAHIAHVYESLSAPAAPIAESESSTKGNVEEQSSEYAGKVVEKLDFTEYLVQSMLFMTYFESLVALLPNTHDLLGVFPASGIIRLRGASGTEFRIVVANTGHSLRVSVDATSTPKFWQEKVLFSNSTGFLYHVLAEAGNHIRESNLSRRIREDFELIEKHIVAAGRPRRKDSPEADGTALINHENLATEVRPCVQQVLDGNWLLIWYADEESVLQKLAKAMRFAGLQAVKLDSSSRQVSGKSSFIDSENHESFIATLFRTSSGNCIVSIIGDCKGILSWKKTLLGESVSVITNIVKKFKIELARVSTER